MTGTEIFKRTPAYEREARDIRLHAPQWKLLLAFDGQRTLAEVALSAEASFAEALPLTQKFLDQGWIEEQPITLDQYLKRSGAHDLSAVGGSVPPAVVLHQPRTAAPSAAPTAKPVNTPLPAPAAPAIVAPPPASIPAAATIPPPLPPLPVISKPVEPPVFAVAPTPEVKTAPVAPAAKAPHGPMKLNAVVDFITSLVGNISLGQLLVYRVFLRVPPDLLLAEDIASVHLVNDTSVIKSEKLQKAIASAVDAVTKRPLPDSVFAPA